MAEFLNEVDFGKIPIKNLVLEQDPVFDTEGQIGYDSSSKKIKYRTNTTIIEIDPSGGGGGSIPDTNVIDESGNTSHTIDFQDLKYYIGCTGDITLDVSSPVSYPITQIVEHKSSNPLNIIPSDDYVLYGIGNLDYNNDGETTNIVLLYLVDGHTDSNGKQIVRVSCAEQPIIPTASNVQISGSAAGIPFEGSFTLDNGTEEPSYTVNQIVKSSTGSDPFTVVSSTNSYTPSLAEDGEYLKYRVKPAIKIGNVIHYASRFFESAYQIISGTVTVTTFESEDYYNALESNIGTSIDPAHVKDGGGSYVLLAGTNDFAAFLLTGATASSALMEIQVRTGTTVSNTRYVSPTMEYVVNVNGTVYSEANGNAFEYDSVVGTTPTPDFGEATNGDVGIIKKTVPLNSSGDDLIIISCNITFGAIDWIKITY